MIRRVFMSRVAIGIAIELHSRFVLPLSTVIRALRVPLQVLRQSRTLLPDGTADQVCCPACAEAPSASRCNLENTLTAELLRAPKATAMHSVSWLGVSTKRHPIDRRPQEPSCTGNCLKEWRLQTSRVWRRLVIRTCEPCH